MIGSPKRIMTHLNCEFEQSLRATFSHPLSIFRNDEDFSAGAFTRVPAAFSGLICSRRLFFYDPFFNPCEIFPGFIFFFEAEEVVIVRVEAFFFKHLLRRERAIIRVFCTPPFESGFPSEKKASNRLRL